MWKSKTSAACVAVAILCSACDDPIAWDASPLVEHFREAAFLLDRRDVPDIKIAEVAQWTRDFRELTVALRNSKERGRKKGSLWMRANSPGFRSLVAKVLPTPTLVGPGLRPQDSVAILNEVLDLLGRVHLGLWASFMDAQLRAECFGGEDSSCWWVSAQESMLRDVFVGLRLAERLDALISWTQRQIRDGVTLGRGTRPEVLLQWLENLRTPVLFWASRSPIFPVRLKQVILEVPHSQREAEQQILRYLEFLETVAEKFDGIGSDVAGEDLNSLVSHQLLDQKLGVVVAEQQWMRRMTTYHALRNALWAGMESAQAALVGPMEYALPLRSLRFLSAQMISTTSRSQHCLLRKQLGVWIVRDPFLTEIFVQKSEDEDVPTESDRQYFQRRLVRGKIELDGLASRSKRIALEDPTLYLRLQEWGRMAQELKLSSESAEKILSSESKNVASTAAIYWGLSEYRQRVSELLSKFSNDCDS